MFVKIKEFFLVQLSIEENCDPQQQLQLAAAALLIELSRADYRQDREEQIAIEAALKKSFSVTEVQLAELIELAEEENQQATSLYEFTKLVKDNYSAEQRFELVKMLWEVAIADGEISKYEDQLIRKISDLIYLPHSDFIRAKLAVLKG